MSSEDWISATQKDRDRLRQYGVSELPTDIGERHNDIENAIQNGDEAARIRSEAEQLLTHAIAAAYMKKREGKLRVPELKAIVDAEVSQIRRIFDDCVTTHRTITSRLYGLMNQSRSR